MSTWTKRKPVEAPQVSQTDAEMKLEQIKQLLFPPLEIDEVVNDEGERVKFHTDRGIDSNLEAIRIELEDGLNDAATRNTITNSVKRLFEVRKILGVVPIFNLDAEYLRVEPLELGLNDDIL